MLGSGGWALGLGEVVARQTFQGYEEEALLDLFIEGTWKC